MGVFFLVQQFYTVLKGPDVIFIALGGEGRKGEKKTRVSFVFNSYLRWKRKGGKKTWRAGFFCWLSQPKSYFTDCKAVEPLARGQISSTLVRKIMTTIQALASGGKNACPPPFFFRRKISKPQEGPSS